MTSFVLQADGGSVTGMSIERKMTRTAPLADLDIVAKHVGASHQAARQRFSSPAVAARYPTSETPTRRDLREWRCISRLLKGVSPGARVLDLPCGAGRMTHRLLHARFSVTAADSSRPMLQRARETLGKQRDLAQFPLRFNCCDVLNTPYENDAFDAVLSNRLFHHFVEPGTRQLALQEMARICRGPIVLSFFRSHGVDAIRFRMKHAIRGSTPQDRVPISLQTLRQDAHIAGLDLQVATPTRWGISPQWYAKFVRSRR